MTDALAENNADLTWKYVDFRHRADAHLGGLPVYAYLRSLYESPCLTVGKAPVPMPLPVIVFVQDHLALLKGLTGSDPGVRDGVIWNEADQHLMAQWFWLYRDVIRFWIFGELHLSRTAYVLAESGPWRPGYTESETGLWHCR
jgi:hypothetical protein